MINTLRQIKSKVYICCNGECTEPAYFQGMKDGKALSQTTSLVVDNQKSGKSPWELVDYAIKKKKRLSAKKKFNKKDGDKMWCVFDIDQYLENNEQKMENAFKLAEKNDIFLAWSNICFELWILLHFQDYRGIGSFRDYEQRISKMLIQKGFGNYGKMDNSIYDKISFGQMEAIKRAEKLYESNFRYCDNPSTNVFKLVKVLRGLK